MTSAKTKTAKLPDNDTLDLFAAASVALAPVTTTGGKGGGYDVTPPGGSGAEGDHP